ncbi:MAG TPA: hypothetical protein VGX49_03060 [Jatrophihabitans sp.]|nr:hypothetical protein [Jatrophihabitans sp.]
MSDSGDDAGGGAIGDRDSADTASADAADGEAAGCASAGLLSMGRSGSWVRGVIAAGSNPRGRR